MKKTYIIPVLNVIKVQMIGAICGVSGSENSPTGDPSPGSDFPTGAPRVV